jgi:4-hydroxybenzoate polyprenyltransferase
MGLAFGWTPERAVEPLHVGVLLVASWLLVAHVFCLNDWAGITTDSRDTNKTARTYLARGASHRAMGLLAAGLGAASLGLFGLLPGPAPWIAALILGHSLLYSHPRFAAKGLLVIPSLLHVSGGLLHFLLGYGLLRPVDLRGVLLGCYCGLVFAAGHLTQEVGDHDGDRRNGIRTSAVRCGRTAAFNAAFGLFTLSYAVALWLVRAGMAPPALLGVAGLYPVHVLLFWRAHREGLTFAPVSRYRRRYRLLYAVIGGLMVAALLGPWLSR